LEHTARPALPEFRRAMLQTSQSLWEKTNVQNLFRYRPSGTYFARFKIGDKPIRQSLETTVFSVAKQRLPEKIREYRSRHESARAFADGKMTVGDAAEVYLRKVRASASLKPRSKNYREMILGFIKRSWPSLLETDVRKVNERDCENWFACYQQRYAPTVVNNSIGICVPYLTKRSALARVLTIRLPPFHESRFDRNNSSCRHVMSS
jgi:hypothetical protein